MALRSGCRQSRSACVVYLLILSGEFTDSGAAVTWTLMCLNWSRLTWSPQAELSLLKLQFIFNFSTQQEVYITSCCLTSLPVWGFLHYQHEQDVSRFWRELIRATCENYLTLNSELVIFSKTKMLDKCGSATQHGYRYWKACVCLMHCDRNYIVVPRYRWRHDEAVQRAAAEERLLSLAAGRFMARRPAPDTTRYLSHFSCVCKALASSRIASLNYHIVIREHQSAPDLRAFVGDLGHYSSQFTRQVDRAVIRKTINVYNIKKNEIMA